jgi:hypothetical protein
MVSTCVLVPVESGKGQVVVSLLRSTPAVEQAHAGRGPNLSLSSRSHDPARVVRKTAGGGGEIARTATHMVAPVEVGGGDYGALR